MSNQAFVFYFPEAQPLSAINLLMPGATLQFYLSGTLSPAPIYSNASLTNQLNPINVQSDGTGTFPTIYCDSTVQYRVRLLDPNNNLLKDIDPINVPGLVLTSLPPAVVLGNPTTGTTAVTNIPATVDGQILTRQSGQLLWSNILDGPININTVYPAIPITLAGPNAKPQLWIQSGNNSTQSSSDIFVQRNGSTINSIGIGPNIELQDALTNNSTLLQQSGGQTELWQFTAGQWAQILKVLQTNGIVINAPLSGSTVTINGVGSLDATGYHCLDILGSSTSGQSLGLRIRAGTTNLDHGFVVQNQAGTISIFEVFGDNSWGFFTSPLVPSLHGDPQGHITIAAPTGGSTTSLAVAGNITGNVLPSSGTFTGTLSGPYTTGITGTFNYVLQSGFCTIYSTANVTATTTSSAYITLSGLPAVCQPINGTYQTCMAVNNGLVSSVLAGLLGSGYVSGSTISIGVLNVLTAGVGTASYAFASGVTAGLAAGWSIHYPLN